MAQYPTLTIAKSALHFTPWQFSRIPSRRLWEPSSHAANNTQRQVVHKHPPLYTAIWPPLHFRLIVFLLLTPLFLSENQKNYLRKPPWKQLVFLARGTLASLG